MAGLKWKCALPETREQFAIGKDDTPEECLPRDSSGPRHVRRLEHSGPLRNSSAAPPSGLPPVIAPVKRVTDVLRTFVGREASATTCTGRPRSTPVPSSSKGLWRVHSLGVIGRERWDFLKPNDRGRDSAALQLWRGHRRGKKGRQWRRTRATASPGRRRRRRKRERSQERTLVPPEPERPPTS